MTGTQAQARPRVRGNAVEKDSKSASSAPHKVAAKAIQGPNTCALATVLFLQIRAADRRRYRHQLNHTSTQAFHCQYADCPRTFVREDLLKRYMDRHAARGPQLRCRDSTTTCVVHVASASASTTSEARALDSAVSLYHQFPLPGQSPQEHSGCSPYTPVSDSTPQGRRGRAPSASAADDYEPGAAYVPDRRRSLSQESPPSQSCISVRADMAPFDVFDQREAGAAGYSSHPPARAMAQRSESMTHFARDAYRNSQRHVPSHEPSQPCVETVVSEYPGSTHGMPSEMMALDQMAMPGALPVFGDDEGLSKSPYVGMPEDFMAYLFNALSSSACPTGLVTPAAAAK